MRSKDYKGAQVSIVQGDLVAERADVVVADDGPVWRSGIHGEMVALERAYLAPLELGITQGARTFAYPSISTGANGFPVDRAAYVALMTIFRFIDENPGKVGSVRIVLFDDATYAIYDSIFQKVVRTQLGTGHEG
jgi:O-acetyl-ADP-ribose deacetylase (regulator of RNase III)